MSTPLHAVENLVQPVEVLDRLGGSVTLHTADHTLGVCPFCASTLWLGRHGWLCSNDACIRLTGGVVDLAFGLMHRQSPTTLEAAVRRVFSIWQNRFVDNLDLQGDSAVQRVCSAHRLRRGVVRWLRNLQSTAGNSAEKGIVMDALLRANVETVDAHTFFPASPEDLDFLLSLAALHHVKMPQLPAGRTLLVVPYGCRMQEVSTLVLMDVASKWQARVDLTPAPVVFSGLWHLSHRCTKTYIMPDPISACRENHRLRLDGTDVAVSYLLGQDYGGAVAPDLPSPVLLGDLRTQHFARVAGRLYETIPDLKVAAGVRKKHMDRLSYFLKLAERHVKPDTGTLTECGLAILGLFHLEGAERSRVLGEFTSRGWNGAYHQVLNDRLVREISRTDKGVLVNTPVGYVLQKKNGAAETISNFTLQMMDAVTFEHQPPFYKVRAVIGSTVLDTICPVAMLDSPRDLSEHLQTLSSVQGSKELPQIQDTQAFRLVSQYWRSLMPRLPVLRGTAFLGWDARFTAFHIPGCQITVDGTFRESRPLHPSLRTMDAYSTEFVDEEFDAADLPRELRTLMLLIIGCCIGGHRRLHMRPVQIHHSRRAARVVESLFRGLGQTRALNRMQNRMPGLQGYPAYVQAAQKDSGTLAEPFFVLCDLGIPVHGEYSDAVLTKAARVLRGLTVKVVEHLLAQLPDAPWERPKSVLWSNELILTAQQVLESCGYRVDAELMSFEFTERLLRQIPKEDLQKICSYDFPNQRVTLDVGNFTQDSGMDMVRLELELRALADNLRVHPGFKIEIDAYSAFNVLQQYYGEVPRLTQIT